MQSALVFPALICFSLLTVSARADQQDLIVPPEDAPQYRLSNLRFDSDEFGRSVIAFDYRRTRGEGFGVRMAGKTDSGPLTIMGFPIPDDDSGTVRLRQTFGFASSKDTNLEIYLVMPVHWAEVHSGTCMVSNPVRMGNPGPQTRARAWNDKEKAAYEKHLLDKQPPPEVPAGYVRSTNDMKLLPGMPVLAGRFGEWQPAEVVSSSQGQVNYKLPDRERLLRRQAADWFAVEESVLEKAKRNAGSFRPSVAVLPDGWLPIPADAVPLAADVSLYVGTPLMMEEGHEWRKVYVMNADRQSVKIRFDDRDANWDREEPRTHFIVEKKTLELLDDPAMAEQFASNVTLRTGSSADAFPGESTVEGGLARPAPKRFKEYPIDIPIPRGAQAIPDDLRLEPGTPVALCWARKWNAYTVLSENPDGTVNVHWNGHADAWDCSMRRDQLIIENKTIRILQRKQGNAAKDLQKTLRTWTDSSGQHKIEARFLRKSETEVTLETDAGREINLPLTKLSKEDVQLLESIPAEVENPFAP